MLALSTVRSPLSQIVIPSRLAAWRGRCRPPGQRIGGADALRAGGNAVDAALGAMLASFVCEPLLTGLGAGGYMLVVAPGPGSRRCSTSSSRRRDAGRDRPRAARGADPGPGVIRRRRPGVPRRRRRRWGRSGCRPGSARRRAGSRRLPLEQLVAPAAARPGRAWRSTTSRRTSSRSSAGIVTSTPEAAALFAPHGRLLVAGDRLRQPELADALRRLGAEGSRPFYEGDIGAAIVDWLTPGGGLVTRADLAAYEVDRPTAAAGRLPRARRAHQPAAVGGRDPHRPRAGDARLGPRAALGRPAGGGHGAHPA